MTIDQLIEKLQNIRQQVDDTVAILDEDGWALGGIEVDHIDPDSAELLNMKPNEQYIKLRFLK